MRYLVCALAALILAVPATAGKGRHKPHDAITVTLTGNQALFSVQHLDAALAPQLAYSLWVSNICADSEGTTVSAEYHPVVWGDNTDPAPVDGTAGTFTTAGVSCTGSLVVFPDVWTPVDSVTYQP